MPKANKKEESPSKKFRFSSLFAKGMAVEDQMSRCAINPSTKDRRPKVMKGVRVLWQCLRWTGLTSGQP